MSTRSKRTRARGHHHAHGHNMGTFEPNTEAPVPPKVSKAISPEAATPDTESVTIAGVLHVPEPPLQPRRDPLHPLVQRIRRRNPDMSHFHFHLWTWAVAAST